MKLTKISPLGKRDGIGTYETFFDPKYKTLKNAIEQKDYTIVDFVKDEDGVIYFEIYHCMNSNRKIHHRLEYQRFPAGVDYSDDASACRIASGLLKDFHPTKKE